MKQSLYLLLGILVGTAEPYLILYYPKISDYSKTIAVIHPTRNNSATDFVTFTKENNALRVHAELKDPSPGKHGFHIHELGDWSCAQGMCTKGHFNPANEPHDRRNNKRRHLGDMGNIVADENENGILDYLDNKMKINGPYSIIDWSVIVHANADNSTNW